MKKITNEIKELQENITHYSEGKAREVEDQTTNLFRDLTSEIETLSDKGKQQIRSALDSAKDSVEELNRQRGKATREVSQNAVQKLRELNDAIERARLS